MSKQPETDQELMFAELLALVAAGRPEHVAEAAAQLIPPEIRGEMATVHEVYAAFGLIAASQVEAGGATGVPRPALRERLLASIDRLATRPTRRALLVLDMQNDHLEPGGPLEVPRAREIVPAVAAQLEAARREGVPVVYVVDEHDASDADLDVWRAHNLRGTPGAAVWPALAPQPGDRVVPKSTYSAFTGSELGKVLDELRVDTLVLTGCLTEIGIHATAVDALQRGYAVQVPPDAQAGTSPQMEGAVLGLLSLLAPYGRARADLLGRISAP